MSSREAILQLIQANKPEHKPLPEASFPTTGVDLVEIYKASLLKNGGKFYLSTSASGVNTIIQENFPDVKHVISLVEGIKGTRDISVKDDPHTLHNLDVAIIQAAIGVAENAALWCPEDRLIIRALPFITQHLIIVINKTDLVANMHNAYAKINLQDNPYGVFIAGPSKTADIEQSLVIGAHGARSLIVALIG